MSLTARSNGGGDFKPAPAGSHAARCCWLIDLGHQDGPYGIKHQALIGWELPTELIEDGDRAGEPYFVSRFYTLSLHEKASLRHDLENWRGRSFTDAELDGFDLRAVVGQPCLLTIAHKEKKGGGISARVAGVTSLPKGMKCPEQVNPSLVFDMDKPDAAVLEALPEWLRETIGKALERNGGKATSAPPPISDEDLPF